jgi:NAD-dependent deacetylase
MPKLIILTGAGLSAESGLRTFRDSNGLWENHSAGEICNGSTWRRNFELVHKFYNDRRTRLATAEPNAAHRMIARWQSRCAAILLTQNVDDLLERAGCTNVVHLHGFLPELCCAQCGHVWNIGCTAWTKGTQCPECRSTRDVRPHIVFFGEPAPHYVAMWSAFQSLAPRDVVLVIGTSGVVLPVGDMARQFPGFKILNNLAPEPAIDGRAFDEVLHMPATKAAEKIDAILSGRFDGTRMGIAKRLQED